MRHFKDIESVRAASVEELEQAPQMNKRAASRYMGFSMRTGRRAARTAHPANTQDGAPSGQ